MRLSRSIWRSQHDTTPVHINGVQIPQENHVKYIGLHLGRRLTWHPHIFAKRKQLGISLTKMYWLLGPKSKLSIRNKLIYKAILKPIWTYGTTSNSNIAILERFQSKVLRLIVNATWYVPNSVIRRDLRLPSVKEEISRFGSHYAVRLRAHPNLAPHSPSRHFTSACTDTGLTTCLPDSSPL
jgi:hypothetical protein